MSLPHPPPWEAFLTEHFPGYLLPEALVRAMPEDTALRFLARMQRLAPNDATRDAIAHAIPVVATRPAIEDRGRMVGDLLLALEETKGVR